MPAPEVDLSSAELETLSALWERGPSTVRDVQQSLADRGRTLAYTTVQTFLNRLEQKGYVGCDCDTSQGPAYVYTPIVSRERIQRSRLRALMDQLYGGAAGPLILQLVRDEGLTSDEVAELQTLIDALDRAAGSRKPKGGK